MTRTGKIARLPKDIRERLNCRLQDGHSGPGLLHWLNNLPECLKVLEDEFESRPITKQNLSEWKQGGYEEWLRKEEACERVQRLAERAEDLENGAGGMAVADRLATVMAMELISAMDKLNEIAEPKERWERLKDILRELYRLRREDHHARKLRMAEEQYERREKEAEVERLLKLQSEMKNKPTLASIEGNGKEAWKWTNWEICVAHGLPMPHWWREPKTAKDWSKLLMPYWEERARRSREEKAGKDGGKEGGGSKMEDGKARTGGMNSALPVKASQTKSDQVKPSQSAKLASSDDDAPGGQGSRNEQEHPTNDEHPTSNNQHTTSNGSSS